MNEWYTTGRNKREEDTRRLRIVRAKLQGRQQFPNLYIEDKLQKLRDAKLKPTSRNPIYRR